MLTAGTPSNVCTTRRRSHIWSVYVVTYYYYRLVWMICEWSLNCNFQIVTIARWTSTSKVKVHLKVCRVILIDEWTSELLQFSFCYCITHHLKEHVLWRKYSCECSSWTSELIRFSNILLLSYVDEQWTVYGLHGSTLL